MFIWRKKYTALTAERLPKVDPIPETEFYFRDFEYKKELIFCKNVISYWQPKFLTKKSSQFCF